MPFGTNRREIEGGVACDEAFEAVSTDLLVPLLLLNLEAEEVEVSL